MTSKSISELFKDCLYRDRSIIWVSHSDTTINVSQLKNAATALYSELAPRDEMSRMSLKDMPLISKWGSGQVAVFAAILGIIITYLGLSPICAIINPFPCGPVVELLGTYDISLLLREKIAAIFPTAILFSIIGQIVYFGYTRTSKTPSHGQCITVYLIKAHQSDGIDIGYSTSNQLQAELKNIFQQIDESIALSSDQDKQTLNEALQIESGDSTASMTPKLVELQYKEPHLFAGIKEGSLTETLCEEDTETPLPLDRVATTLTNYEVPIAVAVTITARASDQDRPEKLEAEIDQCLLDSTDESFSTSESESVDMSMQNQLSYSDVEKQVSGSNEISSSHPNLTSIFDISIRLLIFERDNGPSADEIAQRISKKFEATMHESITPIKCRSYPITEQHPLRFHRTHRLRSLLSDFDGCNISFRGAYRWHGLLTGLNQHRRTTFPATKREVMNYLLTTGNGTPESRRSQQTVPRDQSPTDRPDESQMENIRSSGSVEKFTNNPNRSQSSKTAKSSDRDMDG